MQKRLAENKKSIAIIIALAILLITTLGDVFINRLQQTASTSEAELNRLFDGFLGDKEQELILQGSDKENRIAVVPITGVIGAESAGILQEESVVNQLDLVLDDQSVRGLLLMIDSPGGTVYESARIWQKIKEIQEEKAIPIYSSMGSVAASGGYYVAAPSDKIFASEETITGSIGVIADYVNIAELEEKLGIEHEVIKSGEFKDIGSMSREMSEEERQINQEQVDEFFNKFVQVIADGREMTEKETLALADGRVYTGKQALENGLIDETGYFEDALNQLVNDLSLTDPEVYQRMSSTSRLSQWIGIKSEDLPTQDESGNEPFQTEVLKYIEKTRSEGNLPKFYYLYGGF